MAKKPSFERITEAKATKDLIQRGLIQKQKKGFTPRSRKSRGKAPTKKKGRSQTLRRDSKTKRQQSLM